jgi:uncharacterized tellurite resistance protein B-like protein
MVFWKRKAEIAGRGEPVGRLEALVREYMSHADELAVKIVTAVTGLLGCVAFADRDFSEAEQLHVREVLGRVDGLSPQGVDAICHALQQNVVRIATGNVQAHTRLLRDHVDVEMRREVLEVLVDLAAADDNLSFEETQLLRRIADALALTQDDYNAAQARHRERLSLLK